MKPETLYRTIGTSTGGLHLHAETKHRGTDITTGFGEPKQPSGIDKAFEIGENLGRLKLLKQILDAIPADGDIVSVLNISGKIVMMVPRTPTEEDRTHYKKEVLFDAKEVKNQTEEPKAETVNVPNGWYQDDKGNLFHHVGKGKWDTGTTKEWAELNEKAQANKLEFLG